MVTGLHEETTEDVILDKFSEYGQVTSLHLNLDRKTGFAKGYALIEFREFEEAKMAKESLNDAMIYGKKCHVDFAFLEPPTDNNEEKVKHSK